MADRGLRDSELEALTGGPEEQAVSLRRQMRAGVLHPSRVGLAAFCGHEPSEIIAGYRDPMYMDHLDGVCNCGWCVETLADWLEGLLVRGLVLDGLPLRETRCRFLRVGSSTHQSGACDECGGGGVVSRPWPGQMWLGLRAACVAARAVHGDESGCEFCIDFGSSCGSSTAIGVAERYLREGTLESLGAWNLYMDDIYSFAVSVIKGWLPTPPEEQGGLLAMTSIRAAAIELEDYCNCRAARHGPSQHCKNCGGTGRILGSGKGKVRELISSDLIKWALGLEESE